MWDLRNGRARNVRFFPVPRAVQSAIFRMEAEDGRGIYSAKIDKVIAKILGRNLYTDTTPLPAMDSYELASKLKAQYNFVFGFQSLDHYRQWFPALDVREALTGLGGSLVVYRVPVDCITFGRTQVIFPKRKAARLGSIPPNLC